VVLLLSKANRRFRPKRKQI